MFWDFAHGNPSIHEEQKEPSRKGDRSATMGHTRLEGRTCRERTLVASRRRKWTSSRIREEESDATEKGQENSTEENWIGGWIGQEGERRKSDSAAVIDGIKRKSRIFVRDSIARKTHSRLSMGEDVVVCLPGARIEHVAERIEQVMGAGKG